MSNALAIAAITETLRNLIYQGLRLDISGIEVTTRPLDKARDTAFTNQVNLFLYHATPDPAWRNMGTPWRVSAGETGQPPLALKLYYLITSFYGDNEDATDTTTNPDRLLGSHRLLSRAAAIMHDHPLLDAEAVNDRLPPMDALEYPYLQVEHVRLRSQPLTLDELSKLWSGFQTQYRLSLAYEASVVLIESSKPAKTALPVLTRGPFDRGVAVQPDLTPPFPTLTEAQPPASQTAARINETVTCIGHHLDGDTVTVQFMNRHLTAPNVVAPLVGNTDKQLQVQIPNVPADWPPGFYRVAATISRTAEPDRTTNEVPLRLAATISNVAPNPAARDVNGDVTLTITCTPEIRPLQNVSLLLGDREVPAQPIAAPTTTLQFQVEEAPAGTHLLRLRVDGVDSILINRTVSPPIFDTTQQVTIT